MGQLDDSWWPLGCPLILIPVVEGKIDHDKRQEGSHWTLIAVYPEEKRLVYIDSKHSVGGRCW